MPCSLSSHASSGVARPNAALSCARPVLRATQAGADADALPANLADMTLEDAITHMWEVLDKGQRVEWGEAGFTLDLQQRGRHGADRAANPLFSSVNLKHPFLEKQMFEIVLTI